MPRDRRAVIGTGLWSERSIRELTRRQQQAYLLAYTQPDLNRCGVLAYRPRPWAALATDATEDELDADFQAMHCSRHVVLDRVDEQLLIRTYVRWDGLLTQPLVVAAMVRDYFTITSPLIKTSFLAELRRLFDIALEPKERQGIELAIGTDPSSFDIKNAPAVGKAIGTGLVGPLTDAIHNGLVEPFTDKGLPKGLPEGLREGLTKGPTQGLGEGLPNPLLDPQGQGYARSPVSVPIPVSTPVPIPAPTNDPPPDDDPPDDPTGQLVAEHAAAYAEPLPPSAIISVRREVMRMVAERVHPDRIRAGLTRMRDRQLGPALLPQLIAETTATNGAKPSTADARAIAGLELANRLALEEGGHA